MTLSSSTSSLAAAAARHHHRHHHSMNIVARQMKTIPQQWCIIHHQHHRCFSSSITTQQEQQQQQQQSPLLQPPTSTPTPPPPPIGLSPRDPGRKVRISRDVTPEDLLDEDRPIADFPGILRGDQGFVVIIPPSAEYDVDPTKMTPEQMEKFREESLMKRMQRGVEYNPFKAAAISMQQQLDAEKASGKKSKGPITATLPTMLKGPDMTESRKHGYLPDATMPKMSLRERVRVKFRSQKYREKMMQHLEKNKDTIPEKLRNEVLVMMEFEKRLVDNLTMGELERSRLLAMHKRKFEEEQQGQQQQQQQQQEQDQEQEQNDYAAALDSSDPAVKELHAKILSENTQYHPSIRPFKLGSRVTTYVTTPDGKRIKKDQPSVVGWIFAATMGAIVMFGLSWPGFNEYILKPLTQYSKEKIV